MTFPDFSRHCTNPVQTQFGEDRCNFELSW